VVKIAAVVPARGGSKGVPGKNLKKIGGVTLVGRSVRAAAGSARVDRVYVSSDDDAILAAGEAEGGIAIRRPVDISGDAASSEAAILHALDVMEAAGELPDIVLMLQCTSPFTTSEDVDRLVAALDDERFDASLTVAEDHSFLWTTDAEGLGHGINHNHDEPRKRRQELPPQFRENGAAYAMRVEPFRRVGRRFCGPVAVIETHMPPFEIDNFADLDLANAIARTMPAEGLDFAALSRIKALVTDFDGVHTDDSVYVTQDGQESARCSRRDGMGIEMLRKSGLPILILSKEQVPIVARRAEKLKLEVIHGTEDKLPVLTRWADRNGLSLSDIAYIGNDINDVACMNAVGISFAPADSHATALEAASHVLSLGGGAGAVRELCDLILAARQSG